MKCAFYLKDGISQVVLTPETDTEKAILKILYDAPQDTRLQKGAFFNCRGERARNTSGSLDNNRTILCMQPARAVVYEAAEV